MELLGLEARRSDLARGIVIARGSRPLDPAEQREMWASLSVAGVTEVSDPEEAAADAAEADPEDNPARQWLAASWMPPALHEVDTQRLALEAAAVRYGLEAIWCVKVETAVDGVAWLEEAALAEPLDDEDDDDEERTGETEIVDAIFDEKAEVLYTAPGALDGGGEEDEEEEDDDDEEDEEDDDLDDLDEIEGVEIESHWRGGLPPLEQSVPFPLERYPEIIEDSDAERFGIALKLSGPELPGEESIVNAFFALWLSVYQDERVDEFEPFQRADVVHDRRHRSALMWVERFAVPATPAEQVHFLMWIVARINDIVPIAWARYETVDDAVRARATPDYDDELEGEVITPGAVASGEQTGSMPASASGSIPIHASKKAAPAQEPFVLAGNPFADRFRRHGEEGALAWAVGQSAWSRRELAGMVIEVALEHDPDDSKTALVAERLLRRALAFDATSDATGYLAIVLVRQRRVAEAIALAAGTELPDVRMLVVGELAEYGPDALPEALALLDPATLARVDPEELADLIASIARHAPAHLNAALELLPPNIALVPYLYNASFAVDRPQALALLSAVLALPEPPKSAGEARAALVMAWNNACIHAHALGDFELAGALADAAQRFAPENPYIYHSAACAYAALHQVDRAIAQVRLAIEHDYEHTEKMETDADLAILHGNPRFTSLFVDWRERRADLN